MRQIPGRGRLRERVVTSRGRKYRQAVEYRWDPRRGRGITVVVAHLGPVTPRRSPADKRKVFMVLAALKRARERALQLSRVRPQVTQSSKPKGVGRQGPRRQIDRASVIGSPEAKKLRSRLVRELERSRQGLSRAGLSERLGSLNIRIPGAPYGLSDLDHVGMALTVLHERGRLRRRGRGVKGDPYIYSVSPKRRKLVDRATSPPR
jgi:hypothetical protein